MSGKLEVGSWKLEVFWSEDGRPKHCPLTDAELIENGELKIENALSNTSKIVNRCSLFLNQKEDEESRKTEDRSIAL